MRQHDAKSSAALPPVFVMNTYYTGLGIARNLRGYGVNVFGLSSEADAPGARSRFFERIYRVPSGSDEPHKLCEKLIELRRGHDENPVIFPTRDFDVTFLHNHRHQLGSLYRLPQNGAVECLLDKFALFQIGKSHGVFVPETVVCKSVRDIETVLTTL